MTTTVEPLKVKPNSRTRECARCYGTANHRVLENGKRTGMYACVWCTRRIEAGALIVIGKQLVEPIRRKAKRTGES